MKYYVWKYHSYNWRYSLVLINIAFKPILNKLLFWWDKGQSIFVESCFPHFAEIIAGYQITNNLTRTQLPINKKYIITLRSIVLRVEIYLQHIVCTCIFYLYYFNYILIFSIYYYSLVRLAFGTWLLQRAAAGSRLSLRTTKQHACKKYK